MNIFMKRPGNKSLATAVSNLVSLIPIKLDLVYLTIFIMIANSRKAGDCPIYLDESFLCGSCISDCCYF